MERTVQAQHMKEYEILSLKTTLLINDHWVLFARFFIPHPLTPAPQPRPTPFF